MALTTGPLLLRLLLGVTFAWAGLGKVLGTTTYPPPAAATLANMGLVSSTAGSTAAAPDDRSDVAPLPEPAAEQPADSESGDQTPEAAPAESALPEPTMPEDTMPEDTSEIGWRFDQRAFQASLTTVAQEGTPASASDFPNGIEARNLYGLALLLDSAANPGLDEDANPKRALWPQGLARGKWPAVFAWAAAATELVAGLALLLGILTRVFSLTIAGIMLNAMWLTEIGPAIQSGDTSLGFLPTYDLWTLSEWSKLLWQISLCVCGLALVFMGPGALSLDRRLFRKAPSDQPAGDFELDTAETSSSERDPFDRVLDR